MYFDNKDTLTNLPVGPGLSIYLQLCSFSLLLPPGGDHGGQRLLQPLLQQHLPHQVPQLLMVLNGGYQLTQLVLKARLHLLTANVANSLLPILRREGGLKIDMSPLGIRACGIHIVDFPCICCNVEIDVLDLAAIHSKSEKVCGTAF